MNLYRVNVDFAISDSTVISVVDRLDRQLKDETSHMFFERKSNKNHPYRKLWIQRDAQKGRSGGNISGWDLFWAQHEVGATS